MVLKLYQVDAFSDKIFGGNPAAVCPLEEWLPDDLMQNIALENNLSETAFIVPEGEGYKIRWFTPTVEVDLCGHATLASAHVLFSHLSYTRNEILFQSKSGLLRVTRARNGKISLDFPRDNPVRLEEAPANILRALQLDTADAYWGKHDYMIVLDTEARIQKLQPDFGMLAQSPARGVIVTAPGSSVDFVSRCFYPQSGINEDPVTGSAHTLSAPYWAEKLGRSSLSARQLSVRGGSMDCEVTADRVIMTGAAITFMKGEIEI